MEPILKWAGGKRQLLSQIHMIIPPEDLKGHTLFEPFVGGGSVFLSYEHDKVVINDCNQELINVYNVIKRKPNELILALTKHKEMHSKEYYYYVRGLDRMDMYITFSDVEKAARIIYLNRTCFNGLYRVNSEGYFNVPVGRYKSPDIILESRIKQLSDYFNKNKVKIECGDFAKSTRNAKAGDIVYFDPPYDYEESGFTAYTSDSFSKKDLNRLKKVCDKLVDRGCRVVVSNNDTEYVRELFSDSKYQIIPVLAKRMINCNGTRRSEVKEVLIYGKCSVSTSK